jgi:hypothetical protein
MLFCFVFLRHRATLLCDDHLPQDAVHVALTKYAAAEFDGALLNEASDVPQHKAYREMKW